MPTGLSKCLDCGTIGISAWENQVVRGAALCYSGNEHIYTFENICREDQSISLGDGAEKIFLNADSSP